MAKKSKTVAKKVAGVKVPDALRNAGWLNDALASPLMREALAAALVAGAAAAAAVLTRKMAEADGAAVKQAAASTARKGLNLADEARHVAGAAIAAFAGSIADGVTGHGSGDDSASAAADKPEVPKRTSSRTATKRPRAARPAKDSSD